MGAVLILIAFAALALLLFGMIKPGRVFLGRNSSRKKAAAVYGGVFVAAIIAGVALTEPPAETVSIAEKTPQPTEPTNASTPPPSPAIAPAEEQEDIVAQVTLGVTPESFRESYNSIVGSIDERYKIPALKMQDGQVNDAFNQSLAKNVSVIGSIAKQTGDIKDLMVIVSGGDEEDLARPVLALLAASQAANPKARKEDIAKEVMDITQTAMSNIDKGGSYSRTVGGVRYSAGASRLTGLMLSISPEEN